MSVRPTVIQYCSSLGKACGISTYTQMLCDAQGLSAVRRLVDLEEQSVTHLHVQHEFGIMTLKELKAIRRYCDDRGLQMYVTMHTVIPLPSFGQYTRIWTKRQIQRLQIRLRLRTASQQPKQFHEIKPVSWVWTKDNPEYGWKPFLFFRSCEKFLVKYADTLVVHSDEARDALIEMGAKTVEVVPHALSRYNISPTIRSQKDGKLHVGCFGFLKAHKSLLDIIWACEQLQDVELHLYASMAHSDRHTAYFEHLMNYIADKPWVHLETAFLPLDAVVYRLSQCDANVWYAAPPGAISTSGSIRQYLAAKRPIIAADTVMVSDIRHLVKTVPHGRTDLLVEALRGFQTKTDETDLEDYVSRHTWEKLRPRYEAEISA